MLLRGQAAVVTGGGSGLGAATAALLARAGCRVAVLDINRDAAVASAAACGGVGVACDVADAASAEAALAEARAAHGVERVLVNCAGVGTAGRIVGRDGPLALAAFERVIRVNLIGTFNMLRLSAAAMSALDPLDDGERGVIVNTASIAAYEGQVGQAAYAASKGGVVGHDPAGGARTGAGGGARDDHRAGAVPHADGGAVAAGDTAEPGGQRAVSAAARGAGGIRRAGRAYRDEPVPQRRGDPVGWGAAHGAAVSAEHGGALRHYVANATKQSSSPRKRGPRLHGSPLARG